MNVQDLPKEFVAWRPSLSSPCSFSEKGTLLNIWLERERGRSWSVYVFLLPSWGFAAPLLLTMSHRIRHTESKRVLNVVLLWITEKYMLSITSLWSPLFSFLHSHYVCRLSTPLRHNGAEGKAGSAIFFVSQLLLPVAEADVFHCHLCRVRSPKSRGADESLLGRYYNKLTKASWIFTDLTRFIFLWPGCYDKCLQQPAILSKHHSTATTAQ